MRMRRVAIALKTTGCKVNQADSDEVVRALADLPVEFVGIDDPSDIAVINACTVTGRADREGRASIYRALRSCAGEVILTGCMARNEAALRSLKEGGERLKVVRGVARLIEYLRNEVQRVSGGEGAGGVRWFRAGRARPIIKVQDGCDHRCAYCIVPLVRGPSRSLKIHEVLCRVREVASQGASEVILAGVDLASWGRDLEGGLSLPDLLRALLEARLGLRYRLSSLEPHGLTEDLIDLMAKSPDICPHLHVPLQSGSEKVLRLMNRPYGPKEFVEGVGRAAQRVPGLTIGLDVMCGFPGEEGEDFEETLRLLEALPFTYLHVFPFSRRPGTLAWEIRGGADQREVQRRCEVLRRLSVRRREERAMRMVGKEVEVVDIRPAQGDGGIEGLTAEYFRLVRREAFEVRPGRHFVVVREASNGILYG